MPSAATPADVVRAADGEHHGTGHATSDVTTPDQVPAEATFATPSSRRGVADRAARCVLCISEPAPGTEQVYNVFSSSILLSATRCLLTYIIFPAMGLVPGLFAHSFAHSVTASAIGLPIGVAALVSDFMAIRRFFRADHRWRWVAGALYLAIMGMVSYLVFQDIVHLM